MKVFIVKIIVGLFAVSALFISCDEVEKPYVEYTGECGDASLPIPIKQVLLEEYTGHQCGNCPRAHEKAEDLIDRYCDHIIPVAIHAGFFAETDNDKFTNDFTSEDGDEYNDFFGSSAAGLPSAVINRQRFNNILNIPPLQWEAAISEYLEQDPQLDINIRTDYNDDNRNLTINIEIDLLENISGDHMLSLYFVEDSIISYQKDYESTPQDIEFYVHRHVLRDAINGAWGEGIQLSSINVGETLERTTNYVVNSEWNIKHSSIVAFVYDKNSETKEVIQAGRKEIL